jgi:hypothetical protein
MNIKIKTDDINDDKTMDIFEKISNLKKIVDKCLSNQEILNQELAQIQETITIQGYAPSRYVTQWVFDPRLPFDVEGFGLPEIQESEFSIEDLNEYSGRPISLTEISFAALIDTTKLLTLTVEVGELADGIASLELVCSVNGKFYPWLTMNDGKFQTRIHSKSQNLSPTNIRITAKKIKTKAGATISHLYKLKQIRIGEEKT